MKFMTNSKNKRSLLSSSSSSPSPSCTRFQWILVCLLGAAVVLISYIFLYDSLNYSSYYYNNLVPLSMILPQETTVKPTNLDESATVPPNTTSTNPVPYSQQISTKASSSSSSSSLLESTLSSTTSSKSPLSSLTPSSKSQSSISDLLLGARLEAEDVWTSLIQEASRIRSPEGGKEGTDPGIFMEVGMYRAIQCLKAAIAGHQAHCVEPSQVNFERVQSRFRLAKKEVKARMHLYNVAAGSVTGRLLEFHSGGGTGDRVGHVDVWKMEQNPNEEPTAMTQVEEMRMDDIVLKQPQGAFLIKVDTQGFEPHVFAGLEETLQTHKAKFILMEYWPKGMDLMTSTMGNCSAVSLLEKLSRAGYQLYQLPVTAHPKAPQAWREARNEGQLHLPLDDFAKNCQWYYDMEQRFPSPDYKMGYWSDILAVAPNFKLEHPNTTLGDRLFRRSTRRLS